MNKVRRKQSLRGIAKVALSPLLTALIIAPSNFAHAEDDLNRISEEHSYDQLIVSYTNQGTTAEQTAVREKSRKDVAAVSSRPISARDSRTQVLKLDKSISVEEAMRRLKNQPGIKYVEPDYVVHHTAVSTDPYFTNGSMWGMYGPATSPVNAYGSNAAAAWANGYTGSSNVVIGVVDEGIQVTHSDLAANIWVNSKETPGDGIDNDGNGFIDDVNGWDFVNNDSGVYDGPGTPTTPVDSHGTHVSGTIGALGNGVGVVGVNWNVKIVSAKFLAPSGGFTSDAIKAIDYLTNLKLSGVNIVAINNSWGGGGFSQSLLDAINRAGDAGILFIAAAGNSKSNNNTTANYPSNYVCTTPTRTWDCVVAVASIGSTGSLSSFSNYGSTTVDIGAPGENILSTYVSDQYAYLSGTSMATPHVTGAAALCASINAAITPAQIRSSILNSNTPTTSLTGKTVTGGRLDINKMTNYCLNPNRTTQPTLTVSNAVVSGPAGTAVTLTTSGGSGGGAITFAVTGTNCTLSGATLNSTAPTTCAVVATSAASTNYFAATSASKTFTFTAATQPTLTIGNTVLSNPAGTAVTVSQAGGGGIGAQSIRSTTTGCTVSGMTINRTTLLGSCSVTTTRAANGIYASATSAAVNFTFTATAQTSPLVVSNNVTTITKGTTGVTLTSSGGSGTGTVSYVPTGVGCTVSRTRLTVATTVVGTGSCSVIANKAAQGIYLSAQSAAKVFTY